MISGFLVVRLPHLTFDKDGKGVFPKKPIQLGQIFYGGIDRMPWFDVDEHYYTGTLPPNYVSAKMILKEKNRDFTGIELCYDIHSAQSLLEYSNREEVRNELIALRSEKLMTVKGNPAAENPQNLEWLGYDLIALGHWSLLRDGLFVSPSYFGRWTPYLNENGLISDPTILDDFVCDYSVAAGKQAVEELPDEVYGFDAIQVGRVVPVASESNPSVQGETMRAAAD